MINSRFKFRFWDSKDKEIFYSEIFRYKSLPKFFHGFDLAKKIGNKPILMQWTGVQDNQGQDVYEGDIVKCIDPETKNKKIGSVVFGKNNGSFCFHFANIGTGINTPILNYISSLMCLAPKSHFKVLGNIYQNPELFQKLQEDNSND